MNFQRFIPFTLLIGLCLTSCQAPGGSESRADREARQVQEALDRMGVVMGEQVDSISSFQIRSWNDINDMALVVNANRHEHYLLRLASPCLGLPYSFNVAFASTTSNITPFDDVVVEGLDGYEERCRIREIYRLEHQETE